MFSFGAKEVTKLLDKAYVPMRDEVLAMAAAISAYIEENFSDLFVGGYPGAPTTLSAFIAAIESELGEPLYEKLKAASPPEAKRNIVWIIVHFANQRLTKDDLVAGEKGMRPQMPGDTLLSALISGIKTKIELFPSAEDPIPAEVKQFHQFLEIRGFAMLLEKAAQRAGTLHGGRDEQVRTPSTLALAKSAHTAPLLMQFNTLTSNTDQRTTKQSQMVKQIKLALYQFTENSTRWRQQQSIKWALVTLVSLVVIAALVFGIEPSALSWLQNIASELSTSTGVVAAGGLGTVTLCFCGTGIACTRRLETADRSEAAKWDPQPDDSQHGPGMTGRAMSASKTGDPSLVEPLLGSSSAAAGSNPIATPDHGRRRESTVELQRTPSSHGSSSDSLGAAAASNSMANAAKESDDPGAIIGSPPSREAIRAARGRGGDVHNVVITVAATQAQIRALTREGAATSNP